MRMKILWITNIPSPYRVSFFNELGKLCDLTVVFEKKASDERDKSWSKLNFVHFSGRVLKGRSINTDTAFCPSIISVINKKYDHIIVTNISSLTGILAVEYMRILRIPYWVEGDGGFAKTTKGIRNIIKRHIISKAYGCFSTSQSHDKYYLTYGAEKKRIFRYPFTSVMTSEVEEPLILIPSERTKMKKAAKECLNLDANRGIVLYVGQFIYRKGIDILLNAISDVCKYNQSIDFILIGGELNDEFSDIAYSIPKERVTFYSFKEPDELIPFFKAADCFVLPTREDIWGLVVNEAMSKGLPIITTDRCVAGLELVGDENGRIIPSNDVVALRKAIVQIMDNEEMRSMMAAESLRKIQTYTIENMAMVHMDVFNKHQNKRV